MNWLELAKKIQAISQSGLTYGKDIYDLERYEMLRTLSVDIMSHYTEIDETKIKDLFASEEGYQTPKVDIRAVVFKNNKILMVKEILDGKWSLPGGWADVGDTPSEVAVRETKEEAGMLVKANKLLAVLDKNCHNHPPSAHHIYKMFFLCEDLNEHYELGIETSEVGYFYRDALPELSLARITEKQIQMLFEFDDDPNKITIFD